MAGDRYPIKAQNEVHFSTFTIIEWIDLFTRSNYSDCFVNSVNYCIESKGLEVFAWCIMPSHIHFVSRAKDGFRLSDIFRDMKKFQSKQFYELITSEPESRRDWLVKMIKKAGYEDSRKLENKMWQEDNHNIIIYPNRPDIFDQKVNYIHMNPVKAGYVAEPHHWLYSSAVDYCGGKGKINITLC
jgi:putative transposase